MSAFERATAVTRADEDGYDVTLDAGWSIGGRPNGGYLLAVATRAALDAAGEPHPLAVSGHFLRSPAAGPARVAVTPLRSGRTLSTVGARLVAEGAPCLETIVSAGRLGDEPPVWDDVPAPQLPPVEDCLGGQPPWGHVELLDHVDVRVDPATSPFGPQGPSGVPMVQGWLAFHDGAEADELALLLVVDAMFPVVFNLGLNGWAPTVQLSFYLRGLPEPGWLRAMMRSSLVAGGWFEEDAWVWDSTGRLVAQARQLALVGRR